MGGAGCFFGGVARKRMELEGWEDVKLGRRMDDRDFDVLGIRKGA